MARDVIWSWALPIAVTAALLSAVIIVLSLPWLRRFALARPTNRSSHKQPTPQGGGIGVVAATVIVTVTVLALLDPVSLIRIAPLLAGVIILAVIGAIDDARPLPAAPRIIVQTLTVGLALVTLRAEPQLLPFMPRWIEWTLLLVTGVWFVNLVNFMDGIDWITVTESILIIVGVILIDAIDGGSSAEIVGALTLGSAILGFAPFNRPVAKLFMGDVGSLPIGLLLGWLLLSLALKGHVAAAILLPLYYLADASLTLIRRGLSGERIWVAHRSHFYQRASDNGFTVKGILIRIAALNLVLILLAVMTIEWQGILVSTISVAIGCVLTAALLLHFNHKRAPRYSA